MTCALLDNYKAVEHRARRKPVWGMVTGSLRRSRQFRWPLQSGGHILYRGLNAQSIDFGYAVGVAAKNSRVTEQLAARPVTDGQLTYALRGVGPLGIEDEADPPTMTTVMLVAGVVQLPAPLAPISIRVEPAIGGQIQIIAQIDNINSNPQAATLAVYTDGGTGTGVNYAAQIGADQPVAGPFPEVRFKRDPGLPHGTRIEVGVRAKSAAGAEEQNTDTVFVTLDSQGPPAIEGVKVGALC